MSMASYGTTASFPQSFEVPSHLTPRQQTYQPPSTQTFYGAPNQTFNPTQTIGPNQTYRPGYGGPQSSLIELNQPSQTAMMGGYYG
jgi:hypothetical protein